MGALAGRRVLELADEKGAYCGKLFADMGAEVVKIEPPGGDPTRRLAPFWGDRADPDRGLFFLYHGAGKKSVILDLARAEDRAQFRALAAGADVVIETLAPGALDTLDLGYDALAAANPGLVLTSITGFGQTGPRRDWRASDLVVNALGGAAAVTGEPEDPPVALAGSQAWVSASLVAAAASLIALRYAARTGRGQHVDVSAQEAVASVSTISGVGKWLEDGVIPKRMGSALSASVPSGSYPCKDGPIYLMVNRPAHWRALAEWVHECTGNEEILDPMFEGPSSSRVEHRELLDLFISEHTRQLTVEEVYREGQRRHLAFTPLHTATGVTRDAQLEARGYFAELTAADGSVLRAPGAPYRHSRTPWARAGPVPRAGEHGPALSSGSTAGSGAAPPRPSDPAPGERALDGLRIVEFGAGLAVPWIGRIAAWCGADVIKVESKKYPDVTRLYVSPREPERGIQPQMSPWFTDWNAGKRFVSLDLTRPESIELALELVRRADVVVENYSSGVLEKLGLGVPALRAANPRLVALSSTGYGDSGPCRHYVTWGPNIEAVAGLSRLSGYPWRPCTLTQYAYPDALSALHGLFAILCALEHRDRTGEGQYINLSQLETTVSCLGPLVLEVLANGREPARVGNRSPNAAPQGCYPCRGEDRWCAISAADDAAWEALCGVLDRPGWRRDPRFATAAARREHADALDARLAAATAGLDPFELQERLQAAGVAAGVAQNTEDLLRRDPQLAARGYFEAISHRLKGEVTANGIPLVLSATPGRTDHAGEAIGEHTREVFGDLLGLSDERIADLVALGAIETA